MWIQAYTEHTEKQNIFYQLDPSLAFILEASLHENPSQQAEP